MKYPNLSLIKQVAIDLETKDLNLKELGPGVRRQKAGIEQGGILCVGFATIDQSWCFPWDENTKKFLQDNKHLDWITANGSYEGDFLQYEDCLTNGLIYDILIRESVILGGNYKISLDTLSRQYLNESKQINELQDICENFEKKEKQLKKNVKGYQITYNWSGDARKHLYKLWEMGEKYRNIIMRYCADDCRQTIAIFDKQIERIKKDGLFDVSMLETRLTKPLLIMRKNGVRANAPGIEKTIDKVEKIIQEKKAENKKITGFEVNVNSPIDMEKAFNKLGLVFQQTNKNNPSFSKDNIKWIKHPFVENALIIKKYRKLNSTYLKGLSRFIVNGRLHCNFIQVKNFGYGTETGRLSAINPALQTIPKRGEGKKLIRSLFVPETNCVWERQDQNQEEFRIFAHYAIGEGGSNLRYEYNNNPDMDMHQYVMDITGLNRDYAKIANFLTMYGGGVHKFCTAIGKPMPYPWPNPPMEMSYPEIIEHIEIMKRDFEGARIYYAYHSKMPVMKQTLKKAREVCLNRGYAKTIMGRRRYLGAYFSKDALNTTVQGTGGDIMKMWIVACYESGLFDYLKFHLTVHDEIDFSKPDSQLAENAAQECKRLGESVIKLRVPLLVEREQGDSWGNLSPINI